MPDSFIDTLVVQFNDLMTTGQVPTDWRKTSFKMLPKTMRVKVPSEYRPIATIRLFYKLFAYMILGRVDFFFRVEAQLETHQPEEQHGFRGGRRVEEHLVTTHLVLDKLSSANVPIWIVSLDLSKAFDRVHWPALWRALSEQGLSEHMIWMIQNLYRNQQGQVVGSNGCSRSFDIHGGVRQGCVLSPRLFCSVLVVSAGYFFGSRPERWCESSAGNIDTESGTKLTPDCLCLVPAMLAFQHWSFRMVLRVQSK